MLGNLSMGKESICCERNGIENQGFRSVRWLRFVVDIWIYDASLLHLSSLDTMV